VSVPRARLLDAAVATFIRFGFRKTSMEEVARAAGISRQGLYLHYATKEELFRAAIRHALATGIAAVNDHLERATSLEDKLAGAFDLSLGRFVGMQGDDVTDLHEATRQLVGPLIEDYEQELIASLSKLARSSGLAGAYKAAGLTARQLVETLYATAKGLKHGTATREEFCERMRVAIKAMCLPLR
jgi:TetR/AcrR family transcriptional regulator, regulator of autoinduction and epiphytic fitness